MTETEQKQTTTQRCARCGAERPADEMIDLGAGWACHPERNGGTSCAMQLIFRGWRDS